MSDLHPIFDDFVRTLGSPLPTTQSVEQRDAAITKAAPELYWALYELVKKVPFKASATGITAEISFEQIKKAQNALKKVMP